LVQAGFLKAIRVSHSFYIPSAEAHAKKAIMDSLLKDEVAQRLGLQPNTILYLHRRGKIPAVMTPYGLRFDPQDVLEYQQRHAGMRAPEVRAALHIQQNTLRHLCEQGKLPYTMRGGRRVFDPEAVQQYKERCNT
jgi:DNA-binding transcriptional MerR regulator